MLKYLRRLAATVILLFALAAFTKDEPRVDKVYQVSTVIALKAGVLQGYESIQSLAGHGDFAPL